MTVATCDNCGSGKSVVARERIDPRNFRTHRRTLCDACGRNLGYRKVDYGRGWMESTLGARSVFR